jgi:hypothetical protein
MNILRWILAFPVAIGSWFYFPFVCGLIMYAVHGPEEPRFFIPVIFFLNPIVSLGMLFLILPHGNRSGLEGSIITFSIICCMGAFLISFVMVIGASTTNPLVVLFCELAGTIVGAVLAYACIPLKCRGISN